MKSKLDSVLHEYNFISVYVYTYWHVCSPFLSIYVHIYIQWYICSSFLEAIHVTIRHLLTFMHFYGCSCSCAWSGHHPADHLFYLCGTGHFWSGWDTCVSKPLLTLRQIPSKEKMRSNMWGYMYGCLSAAAAPLQCRCSGARVTNTVEVHVQGHFSIESNNSR